MKLKYKNIEEKVLIGITSLIKLKTPQNWLWHKIKGGNFNK